MACLQLSGTLRIYGEDLEEFFKEQDIDPHLVRNLDFHNPHCLSIETDWKITVLHFQLVFDWVRNKYLHWIPENRPIDIKPELLKPRPDSSLPAIWLHFCVVSIGDSSQVGALKHPL